MKRRGAAGLGWALALALASAHHVGAQGVRVLPTGGLDMEQAALLLSGQEGGLLPLAVFASPLGPAADGGAATVVVIEVAGASLLATETTPLYLDVCVYVLSGDPPSVTVSALETLEIDLEQQRDVLANGGIQVVRRLTLPAGAHSLRTLVRNRATRDLGLRVTPLVVPDFGDASPVLLGPFFAAAGDSWLAVARGDAPADAWLAVTPAALPLLAVESTASLRVVASSALAAGTFAVELQREGKTVAKLPAAVEARTPVAGGLELLTLRFDPAAVAAGVAELRVRASGGAMTAPVKVVLTQGPQPSSWAAVFGSSRAPAAGSGGSAARPPAAPTPRRQSERQLARRYREALQQLAGDTSEAGIAAVAALESAALAGDEIEPQALRELERGVLAPLIGRAPEALWPVLDLYLSSHRQHLAARSSRVATHAQQMVMQLAELYAATVAPEARGLAAAPLLALVTALPDAERELRIRALATAREYRPADAGVLFCIAVDAERHADYRAAVEALTALRRLAPQDLEARARLGVNQLRLGAQRQARVELNAAVGANDEPPPWWLPVAYQELGRLQLESGDLAAAERVLRQGLVRLPHEEKLSLLLAQVLERRGQKAEAVAVVAAIEPTAVDRGFDSARHRYVQFPNERLAWALDEVAARAAAARAALAAALSSARAEAGP